MSKRNKHVIVKNVRKGYELECLNCGMTYTPALPCPMDIFVAITETFSKKHEGCEISENRPAEPFQDRLPESGNIPER